MAEEIERSGEFEKMDVDELIRAAHELIEEAQRVLAHCTAKFDQIEAYVRDMELAQQQEENESGGE